ncbi:MAG: hypothetical protein V4699_03230 [Patescibacteria group bacterium]
MRTEMFVELVKKLEKTHKDLEGHRIMFSQKTGLIVVPFKSGLWAKCEEHSFWLVASITSRSDLRIAKRVAIRTEKTVPLFEIMERAFPKRKRK